MSRLKCEWKVENVPSWLSIYQCLFSRIYLLSHSSFIHSKIILLSFYHVAGTQEPERQWQKGTVNRSLTSRKMVCTEQEVKLLSHVLLFVTLWTAAHQASLSFSISWSWLKLMFFELVTLPSHLVLCHPFAFSLSQNQGLFQRVSSLPQVAKVLSVSFS